MKTATELRDILAKPFRVEYAYPTSDDARTVGKYRTGAYVIVRRNGANPATLVSSHGYDTSEEAEAFARIYNQVAI